MYTEYTHNNHNNSRYHIGYIYIIILDNIHIYNYIIIIYNIRLQSRLQRSASSIAGSQSGGHWHLVLRLRGSTGGASEWLEIDLAMGNYHPK